MSRTELNSREATRLREQWQQVVKTLMDEVRAWAEAQSWRVELVSHTLKEASLGEYSVPGLEIHTPEGQLMLEPVGRDVLGAEGRIDFYAWPTLYRVLLLLKPERGWVVRTEFGPNWPNPWGPTTFVELAKGLLSQP